MKLIEATSADSERLRDFYHSFIVPGRVDIAPLRKDDFFSIYKIQTDSHRVFLLEDDFGKLHGSTAISYREAHLDKKIERVGFLRDLRITNNARALLKWSRLFLPTMREEMERENCRYFFSVMNHRLARSYTPLIRPRKIHSFMPRYSLLRGFDLIALHGRLPLVFRPLKSIHISQASNRDLPELAEYLKRSALHRDLAPVFDVDFLLRSFHSWPGLTIEDFLISRDIQKNICGCVAPWSIRNVADLVVHRHHGASHWTRKLLTWGSLPRITRRIAKSGEPLEVQYLTHLFADNPDIFHSLLDHAWNATGTKQTLLYPNYKGEVRTLPPFGFIFTRTPHSVFTVLPPEAQLPNFLRPRLTASPPFIEPALL